MHVTPTHHRALQRVYDEALAEQVVVLSDEEREDLSWNLADVTASCTSWEAVHTALLAELAHRGVGEDHGEDRLPPLADVLLRAVQAAPDPAPELRRSWWTRWREARAARTGRWCTVEPWGQDDDGDRDVLRALLHALRPWADQLQTDLPLALREQWPREVVAAAEHLHAVSPCHRGDTDEHATTGWLPVSDDATWAAFVTFAPHALDADVVADEARVVVGIADEGTSLALRLTAEQREAVEAVLGSRQLRPLRRRTRPG